MPSKFALADANYLFRYPLVIDNKREPKGVKYWGWGASATHGRRITWERDGGEVAKRAAVIHTLRAQQLAPSRADVARQVQNRPVQLIR